jgi:hypothetical protein
MQALVILDFPHLYDTHSAVPTRVSDMLMEPALPKGVKRVAEGVWLVDFPSGYAFLSEVSNLCFRSNLTHHVVFLNESNEWVHSVRKPDK